MLASVRAVPFARDWQPDRALVLVLAFTVLGGWLCLVVAADAVACTADVVEVAPSPDDEAATVPHPAGHGSQETRRHRA